MAQSTYQLTPEGGGGMVVLQGPASASIYNIIFGGGGRLRLSENAFKKRQLIYGAPGGCCWGQGDSQTQGSGIRKG